MVVGYGSVLRGDDAAGARAAAAVARWGLPGVRAIVAHQLTPELAEPLSRAGLAIFVDARAGGGGVRARQLSPADTLSSLDMHIGDPAALLALAQALYDRAPRAWLITIPAQQFTLGAPLSPRTRRALPIARRRIRRLIEAAR
ncbi:hydrogenase maturation protease [Oscillochloris sp. ZM17-4]|uniref:hydrogenase maturation protease n=1 Tax=Oscillochloris sp. ZM17-4 TaxID=2866714 RepID=UPI001C72A2A5|nr:hydrogenase maturation protease [Oscillochloris sp. ZM17-4]MBX0329152.1 hydrogenase maturation protease [Oscillochloris sp. ZM17-4]